MDRELRLAAKELDSATTWSNRRFWPRRKLFRSAHGDDALNCAYEQTLSCEFCRSPLNGSLRGECHQVAQKICTNACFGPVTPFSNKISHIHSKTCGFQCAASTTWSVFWWWLCATLTPAASTLISTHW